MDNSVLEDNESYLNKLLSDFKIKFEKDSILYGTTDLKCVMSFFPRKLNDSTKSKANEIIAQIHTLRSKAVRDRKKLSELEVEINEQSKVKESVITMFKDIDKRIGDLNYKLNQSSRQNIQKTKENIKSIENAIVDLKKENRELKRQISNYTRKTIKLSNKDVENTLRWEAMSKCVKKIKKEIKVEKRISEEIKMFNFRVCDKDVERIDFDPGTYEELLTAALFCCHTLSFGLISEASQLANILVQNLKIGQYQEFFLMYLICKYQKNDLLII